MPVRKIITKCVPIIYRILQYRQLTLERAPCIRVFDLPLRTVPSQYFPSPKEGLIWWGSLTVLPYYIVQINTSHYFLQSKTPESHLYSSKGRRQNSSVASGDFLQRMTNVGWQGFCSSVTSLPHGRLKVTPGDDIQLLFPIHFNVFL